MKKRKAAPPLKSKKSLVDTWSNAIWTALVNPNFHRSRDWESSDDIFWYEETSKLKLISAGCSLTFKDFQFLSKSCQMYRKIGSLLFRLSASVRYLHPHTITHRCGGISKNFLLFKSSYCRGRLLLKSENEARLQFSKGTLIRYLHTVTFTIFFWALWQNWGPSGGQQGGRGRKWHGGNCVVKRPWVSMSEKKDGR